MNCRFRSDVAGTDGREARNQDVPARLRARAVSACIAFLLAVVATTAAPVRAAVQPKPPARPGRIVSLVPAVTEMIFALGAGNRVAAVRSSAPINGPSDRRKTSAIICVLMFA